MRLQRKWLGLAMVASAFLVTAADAGETILYQPPPEWVVQAPPITPAKLGPDAPLLLTLDNQQRIEGGKLSIYLDRTLRAASPEAIGQIATLSLPWFPDKGDLIIHHLEILRGDQRIDLIAQGQKFTAIRRELGLEQRQLDGGLTATLAVEGLQTGDVLRLAFTQTVTDPALKGRSQSFAPVIAEPLRVFFARLRLSWPKDEFVAWKTFSDARPTETVAGRYRIVELQMPVAKQPELPNDIPRRFLRPPIIELSSFRDWADVAAVMTPLYATDGLVAADGALAREIATIAAAETDPMRRAQRALQAVQDKVRYFAVFMNGGNYVPQGPERTWEVRYGDCKAKTLLLLAMLRGLGIAADPVLASIQTSDFVAVRLPSALAFDHVLVRATIAGQDYWLDGTSSGSRLDDLADTPPFRLVLPLKPSGAMLTPIPARIPARPSLELTFDIDESTSIDLPVVGTARVKLRGPFAGNLSAGDPQASAKDRLDLARGFLQPYFGEVQLGRVDTVGDPLAGEFTLNAQFAATTRWYRDEKRRLRAVGGTPVLMPSFEPDRSRASWSTLPVAGKSPQLFVVKTRITLPSKGAGFALEGAADTADEAVADYRVTRNGILANGVMTIEERIGVTGQEIAAPDIAAQRARYATFSDRPFRLIAPADTPRRWQVTGRTGSQMAALEAVFAKAIADDPDDPTGYESRASLRAGILDRQGAIADLSKALAIQPTIGFYLRRSALYDRTGRRNLAIKDAEAALALDASSQDAIAELARLRQRTGDLAGALALVDPRIEAGGDSKSDYLRTKAELLADGGRIEEAAKVIDSALATKPGTPALLNARCWLRGTHNIDLASALKDCTRAIELSDDASGAIDSRALVYFRLGRTEEALADSDAVLEALPDAASVRYLRGLILKKVGRTREATDEVTLARRLDPTIDEVFAIYKLPY
jgi:tetratricopeptide (TPR) repeat protein/transglutaminase-like putative cysteine protease